MPKKYSREILLRERPVGMPTSENFELAEVEVPELTEGEFLVRNIWMSVEPVVATPVEPITSITIPKN